MLWIAEKYDLIEKNTTGGRICCCIEWIPFWMNHLFFPIRMKVTSFLKVLPKATYTLEAFNSILVNSYSYLNEAHWSLCIVITKLYLTIVWLIMPHIFNIDIHIHSSSRTSSYKIPSLFLEVYTNMMEGQHFQLTWLVKQSQVLVHE